MLKLAWYSVRASFTKGNTIHGFLYGFLYGISGYIVSRNIDIPFAGFMLLLSIHYLINFPHRITKGLFLCPTNYKQRKQFMRNCFLIKSLLLTGIFLIGMLISYLFLNFSPIDLLFGTLYYFMLTLILNLQSIGYVIPNSPNSYRIRQRLNHLFRLPRERFFSICCIVFLIIGLLIFLFLKHFTIIWYIANTITILVNAILVMIYLKKYATYVISLSIDYEIIYTPTNKRIWRSTDASDDIFDE